MSALSASSPNYWSYRRIVTLAEDAVPLTEPYRRRGLDNVACIVPTWAA